MNAMLKRLFPALLLLIVTCGLSQAAVLRRAGNSGLQPEPQLPVFFCLGEARIDRKNYQLENNGVTHSLTPREMKLLETFLCHPDQVLSRNELLNAAWGVDYFGTTRTLDQHIAQLRKKIETDPAAPKIIRTVHGVGYRLGIGL